MKKIIINIGRQLGSGGRSIAALLAKHYNIKGADALIDKCLEAVSKFEYYADKAGIDGQWTQQIKEEISYRVTALDK